MQRFLAVGRDLGAVGVSLLWRLGSGPLPVCLTTAGGRVGEAAVGAELEDARDGVRVFGEDERLLRGVERDVAGRG
jgi:hypothetical protein